MEIKPRQTNAVCAKYKAKPSQPRLAWYPILVVVKYCDCFGKAYFRFSSLRRQILVGKELCVSLFRHQAKHMRFQWESTNDSQIFGKQSEIYGFVCEYLVYLYQNTWQIFSGINLTNVCLAALSQKWPLQQTRYNISAFWKSDQILRFCLFCVWCAWGGHWTVCLFLHVSQLWFTRAERNWSVSSVSLSLVIGL